MRKIVIIFIVLLFTQINLFAKDSIKIGMPKDSIVMEMSENTLMNKDKILIFQRYIEDELNNNSVQEKCNHISAYSEIESVIASRVANRISKISIIIAVISTMLTLLIFMIQSFINKRQKKDITIERFENHLYGCINQLDNYIDKIEIYNVCKGRKSFNFLFYEYEMLVKEFQKQNLICKSTNKLLTIEDISSLAISFIINGITPNSTGDEHDIIFKKYSDFLTKDDYIKLRDLVDSYENMNDELLESLYCRNSYTLIMNYANIKLKENKRVPWFWGVRFYYIPYAKQLANIFTFLSELDAKIDRNKYYSLLDALFNDSELGLLYAYVNSRENRGGLNIGDIEKIIKKCELDDIYNYKKWV